MFSVIIPLYNKELSIKNTIQSVLDQAFKDFEIIIVNDGSMDGSINVISTFCDKRIRIINQNNQGVSAARNRGIKEAQFNWICFLDGDDLWKKNHLVVMREMIGQFQEEKVFCTSIIINNRGYKKLLTDHKISVENYFKGAIKNNFFCTTITICLHKSVFENIGMFDIRLNRGEDLELWTRIGRKFQFVKSNLITAIYRMDAENRSDKTFNLYRSRVYNYEFKLASSNEEIKYYRFQITRVLRGFIRNIEIMNFLRLYYKHRGYIKLQDLFKNRT